MSSRQTAHYGLNQWEAGDKVVREEFNGDNAKIDQALHTLAQGKAERPAMEELAAQLAKKYGDDRGLFYSGRYTGDGEETVRDYPAPFRPSFLFLFREDNSGGQYTYLCALGTEQIQFIAATSTGSTISTALFSFRENGFQVDHSQVARQYGFNVVNIPYRYVAVR